MSQIFFVGVAIFLCTFMFCSLLPGILLYEYGYKPEMAWAERAVETNCFISKYSVESVNCGMQRTSCFVAILSVSFTTTNGQNMRFYNQYMAVENERRRKRNEKLFLKKINYTFSINSIISLFS